MFIFTADDGGGLAGRHGEATTALRIVEQPQDAYVNVNDPLVLPCSARGAPTATGGRGAPTAPGALTVRWFHNGRQVATGADRALSPVAALESGQLFFLRVTAELVGTYYCNVTNGHGAYAVSKNATIRIGGKATILDKFDRSPFLNLFL